MSTENSFRILIFIAVVVSFTISGYFRRKADRSDQKTSFEEENQTLLKVRNIAALLMYGSILIYLVYPPLLGWAHLAQFPIALRWAAIGIMFLCVIAFYWLFSSLGNNVTPTVTIRKEHQLVTSGPYRWIRHPLYTFGFINILSLSVAAANWFIFALAWLTFIPLAMRTPLEEERLLETFGEEYKSYINKTGRYLPKLK
ncbi:MAG: isoprenylcysteine carboxylmethyltransferase family protein [Anaerolineales bacterium]|jgi:protein-S-isoprenylcysteine O-methyltransferase Ste14